MKILDFSVYKQNIPLQKCIVNPRATPACRRPTRCGLAERLRKAWMALSLPISPRWRAKHRAERDAWLRMEFRTFLNAVINIPAQVVNTSRRLVIRLLAYRPQLDVFLRLAGAT